MQVMTAEAPPDAGPGFAPALALLHEEHQRAGFLGEEAIRRIAGRLGTSPAELYGAVTAYPLFRVGPGPSPGAPHADPFPLPPIGNPVLRAAESVCFGADDPVAAARKALELPPDEILSRIARSEIRGYGGAGFPTARKWEAVRRAPGPEKYVIANADESEPGCFKDRLLLDRQPRRILAGMRLAAHAAGAARGILYIRHEYAAQHDRVRDAIGALREEGFLGPSFDVVLRRGAGAYICGEETALLNSLEGKRPVPRDRPPYPVVAGLFGRPTLVQNVETLAAIPAIIERGPDWFRGTGPAKLYSVSGDVPRPGVYELPMTATAGELLREAGADPETLAAFTLGGVSGGLLPAAASGVRLDFESPARYGAALGAGGIIALARGRCVVRFARDVLSFFARESCGKCFPCRIGTTRLLERLDRVIHLASSPLDEFEDLIGVLKTGSACGLGPSAALMARHLATRFGDDLRAHAVSGNCPAGACTEGA